MCVCKDGTGHGAAAVWRPWDPGRLSPWPQARVSSLCAFSGPFLAVMATVAAQSSHCCRWASLWLQHQGYFLGVVHGLLLWAQ